jgi:hypothetical protein
MIRTIRWSLSSKRCGRELGYVVQNDIDILAAKFTSCSGSFPV